MERFYTSKEQSKRLVEMGINPETADLSFYYKDDEPQIIEYSKRNNKRFWIPCWSLVALLNLIPNFELITHDHKGVAGNYRESFIESGFYQTDFKTSLVDCAFEMVVYLLECENQFGKDGTYMKTRNIND